MPCHACFHRNRVQEEDKNRGNPSSGASVSGELLTVHPPSKTRAAKLVKRKVGNLPQSFAAADLVNEVQRFLI